MLALQGDVREHQAALADLGADTARVRTSEELAGVDALVIPGGESTAIAKLLAIHGMYGPLRDAFAAGMAVFGTCAGAILMARDIEGARPDQEPLALMDVRIRRNAYGRQLGSFHTVAQIEGVGEIPMTFIRAPYIAAVGPKAQVLAEVDGHIVAARQGNQLVTAFHPELDEDTSVHQYFLDMTK